MIVKNESRTLPMLLRNVYDLFDSITIIDTGSTDDTVAILQSYNISPIKYIPTEGSHYLLKPRNISITNNPSEWILILDADETITRKDLISLKSHIKNAKEEDGFFLPWRNFKNGKVFDDYKLCVFRNNLGIHFEGIVHACPQVCFRRKGFIAKYLSDICLEHRPEKRKDLEYRQFYITQLKEGLADDPSWIRYNWFLGYDYFKHYDYENALMEFYKLFNASSSIFFPVETLNAYSVAMYILYSTDRNDEYENLLKKATEFYEMVKFDFEVIINNYSWLNEKKMIINEYGC